MISVTKLQELSYLLTTAQTAEILNCSEKTVQRRIAAGDLPVIQDGNIKRVHPSDLARYINARRTG